MKTEHNLILEDFQANLSLIEGFENIVIDSVSYRSKKFEKKKTTKKRLEETIIKKEKIIDDLNRLTLIKAN